MVACAEVVLEPTGREPESYRRALDALTASDVRFLAGGAVALAAYTGIRRNTKDLDLFLLERDVGRCLEVLERAGFRTATPFPHWLAKAYAGEHFIDVIFSSGNGAAPVDDEWFEHAVPAVVFGARVLVCPVEETIWSKAFVMERERFDGADVAHLLLERATSLDWARLLRRFGEDWPVLLSHLVLFGYAFPGAVRRVPRWVVDELLDRQRRAFDLEEPRRRVCRGTLLSREQYLPDLERGWLDARLPPTGSMSTAHVAIWTQAIDRDRRDPIAPEGRRSSGNPSSSLGARSGARSSGSNSRRR